MAEALTVTDRPDNAALLKLRGIRGSLRSAERQVAEFIIGNPEQVIYSTVSDVALGSGVSEATVIRMCRSAGFSGFSELKIQLARASDGPIMQIQRDLVDGDDPATVLEKVFRANVQALLGSLQTIDHKAFEEAVEIVANAERVILIGVGTSGTVAMEAVQKFLVAGVRVVAYSDIVLQALSASTCAPGDAFIGLSQSGETETVVESLRSAGEHGATTIAVTSGRHSLIARAADVTLLLTVPELSFQATSNQSRTAQLSMLDALCVSVAMRRPDVFARNSARMEAIARRLHGRR